MLAKFVGYRNFDAFCNHRKDFECVQSRIIGSDSIDVKNLLRGELLHITWLPDRSVIVKYMGNSRFEVTESINSKLSVGDTFSCNLFIQNELLYLSNLIHEGSTSLNYVAGENNGVNIRVLIGVNIKVVNYISTLFVFLVVANLSGLFGFRPPTADYSVTFALAIITSRWKFSARDGIIISKSLKKIGKQ